MEISIPCVYSCGMKTNDNTGGAENFGTWADESILLCRAAHISVENAWSQNTGIFRDRMIFLLNVCEHPRLNTKLDGSCNDGGHDLRAHILVQLKIDVLNMRTWLQNMGFGGTVGSAIEILCWLSKGDKRHTFHVMSKLEVRSESQSLGHCLIYMGRLVPMPTW